MNIVDDEEIDKFNKDTDYFLIYIIIIERIFILLFFLY